MYKYLFPKKTPSHSHFLEPWPSNVSGLRPTWREAVLQASDRIHSISGALQYNGLHCSKYHWTCIHSLKVRSRLILGADIFIQFFLFLLHARHEIENLREKSSIQMAFSKRQKTVRIWFFTHPSKSKPNWIIGKISGPWHNGIWDEFDEEVFGSTQGRAQTSWDCCYQRPQKLEGLCKEYQNLSYRNMSGHNKVNPSWLPFSGRVKFTSVLDQERAGAWLISP